MLRRRILTTLPVAALVLPELEPAKGASRRARRRTWRSALHPTRNWPV